ncbi:MAG: cytochrome P450 [Pseudomonadales bacterium]|nr:cytochrome P450 [Pseudomonadales bacterium]MBO6597108.1 cytochrome P450 [Pseudomonadales bacterium]MBO6703739.1 cytochrome P450 [Pseudomonadales bacterium]MBO6823705.1 cytochrome P450 [Pseudomonadales bacterium]MBO7005214.1 cytochrome P450 [Pseudomonadales bacterium]
MFDYRRATRESAAEFAATAELEQLDVSNHFLFQRDAHWPLFERLRREAPVNFHPESRYGPYWSITSHRAIKEIEADHHRFSSEPNIGIGDAGGAESSSFISMDSPKHDTQRATVSPVVAPSNLANLETLIRTRVEDILDNLPVGEEFNWVERVSIELTTRMLATLFDFPFEERSKLTRWSDIGIMGPKSGYVSTWEEGREELQQCLAYFKALYKERLEADHEGFDLLSLLARNPETRDMPDTEFLGNLMLLIVGGNDTTRNSISGGVLALNQFPDQYEKLRGNLSLIPNMVAEIIRWQTPLAHMRRTASEDVEFHGQKIRKGDKVVMWYVSGNRDDSVFENPDKLMIDRKNARQHVSFGFGIHRCMGNRLAEMQLRVLWEEISQRFRHVEVVGEPERVTSNFVKGYSRLPVVLHPLS